MTRSSKTGQVLNGSNHHHHHNSTSSRLHNRNGSSATADGSVDAASATAAASAEQNLRGIGDLFDVFIAANTLKNVVTAHQKILNALDLRPGSFSKFFSAYKKGICGNLKSSGGVVRQGSWKATSILGKIERRAQNKVYSGVGSQYRSSHNNILTSHNVLLIGGGPCGLRTAIELQFLGADHTVIVEKRDRFSRNNVLHLWPFVIDDLKALGAKKFYGKFCAGSIDHCSIRQLQLVLLKVALIVGCEFREGVAFEELCPCFLPQHESHATNGGTSGVGNGSGSKPNKSGCCCHTHVDESAYWGQQVGTKAHFTFMPAVEAPIQKRLHSYPFDILIGADGRRNTLSDNFPRKEFRGRLAIAITANFINRHTMREAQLAEISGISFIYNQQMFRQLENETGIDLENICYYKDDTHYFVMTAKKSSLLARRVLKQNHDDTRALLAPDNVNRSELLRYAKDAALWTSGTQSDPKESQFSFALNHYGEADVAMFDFTSMCAAENACKVKRISLSCVRCSPKEAAESEELLLMSLVGDSLLEPFWPMGTGLARGFLSGFDTAWLARRWTLMRRTLVEIDKLDATRDEESKEIERLIESATNTELASQTSRNREAKGKNNFRRDFFTNGTDESLDEEKLTGNESMLLQVLAERESIYRLLAQTKSENLNQNFAQYTINPVSRYPNLNTNTILSHQVRHLLGDEISPPPPGLSTYSSATLKAKQAKEKKEAKRSRRATIAISCAATANGSHNGRDRVTLDDLIEPNHESTTPLSRSIPNEAPISALADDDSFEESLKNFDAQCESHDLHTSRRSSQDVTASDFLSRRRRSHNEDEDEEEIRELLHRNNFVNPVTSYYSSATLGRVNAGPNRRVEQIKIDPVSSQSSNQHLILSPSASNLASIEKHRIRDIEQCIRQRRQHQASMTDQESEAKDILSRNATSSSSRRSGPNGGSGFYPTSGLSNDLYMLRKLQASKGASYLMNETPTSRSHNDAMTSSYPAPRDGRQKMPSFSDRVKRLELKLYETAGVLNEDKQSDGTSPPVRSATLGRPKTVGCVTPQVATLQELLSTQFQKNSEPKKDVKVGKITQEDWNVRCWEDRTKSEKQPPPPLCDVLPHAPRPDRAVETFKDKLTSMETKLTDDASPVEDDPLRVPNYKPAKGTTNSHDFVHLLKSEFIARQVSPKIVKLTNGPLKSETSRLFRKDDNDNYDAQQYENNSYQARARDLPAPKKAVVSPMSKSLTGSCMFESGLKIAPSSSSASIASLQVGMSSSSTSTSTSSRCTRCGLTVPVMDRILLSCLLLHRTCLSCSKCGCTLRLSEVREQMNDREKSTTDKENVPSSEDINSSSFFCSLCAKSNAISRKDEERIKDKLKWKEIFLTSQNHTFDVSTLLRKKDEKDAADKLTETDAALNNLSDSKEMNASQLSRRKSADASSAADTSSSATATGERHDGADVGEPSGGRTSVLSERIEYENASQCDELFDDDELTRLLHLSTTEDSSIDYERDSSSSKEDDQLRTGYDDTSDEDMDDENNDRDDDRDNDETESDSDWTESEQDSTQNDFDSDELDADATAAGLAAASGANYEKLSPTSGSATTGGSKMGSGSTEETSNASASRPVQVPKRKHSRRRRHRLANGAPIAARQPPPTILIDEAPKAEEEEDVTDDELIRN